MDQLIGLLTVQLAQANSTAAVRAILTLASNTFDAPFYLFTMQSHRKTKLPSCTLSNYPKGLRHYYDSVGAANFDPILQKSLTSRQPFRWEGLYTTLQQKTLEKEYLRYGMVHGISVADHGADGSAAVLCFAGKKCIADGPGQWEKLSPLLTLLALTTHHCMREIGAKEGAQTGHFGQTLSSTELRCLSLIAASRTAKEAAIEMGVSPRTICYYLDRAAEKLGLMSRREAVHKAIELGLINSKTSLKIDFESTMEFLANPEVDYLI